MNIQHINGAVAEHKLIAAFLSAGYQVFTPVVAQSKCDFILYKDNKFTKVQAKKLSWAKTGSREYLSTRLTSRNKYSQSYNDGDFDLLACIDCDGRIFLYKWDDIKGRTSIQVDKRDIK